MTELSKVTSFAAGALSEQMEPSSEIFTPTTCVRLPVLEIFVEAFKEF